MTKKISLFLIFIAILFSAQRTVAFSIHPLVNDPTPVSKSYDYLRGDIFVKMSAKEFAKASGVKLNFFQRLYFHAIKHQVKRDLKNNPDLLITDYFDTAAGKFKFSALWFVIAAFVGPFGVLLAYYSHPQKNGPNKKDRVISAWLGFVLFVIWFGVIFLF